jgi:hypothetical protein
VISEILRGKGSITAETALRPGRYFGMEPQFWLNLQSRHDLLVAEQALRLRLEQEVRPRAAVCSPAVLSRYLSTRRSSWSRRRCDFSRTMNGFDAAEAAPTGAGNPLILLGHGTQLPNLGEPIIDADCDAFTLQISKFDVDLQR